MAAASGPTAGKRVPFRAVRKGAAVACALAFAVSVLGALPGCRSRAYQDVYVDQLASEIRVLEDQLYEADYENKVLRQKLQRAVEGLERRRPVDPEDLGLEEPTPEEDDSFDEPDGGDYLDRDSRRAAPDANEIRIDPQPDGDLELDIDLGDPGDFMDSNDLGAPGAIRGPAGVEPGGQRESGDTLPPVQVLPPRAEDLEPPLIELGDPAPPGGGTEEADVPPGQIPTPESATLLLPDEPSIPTAVEIHPGLSGGHHADNDNTVDGVYLVLSIQDQMRRPMRSDLPISIVMLDPAQEGPAARLGRWDYTAAEAAALFRDAPVPSFQMPLLWDETPPRGEEVAVFVRVMREGEPPLEHDMLLRLGAPMTADWNARGLGGRRAGIPPATAWK